MILDEDKAFLNPPPPYFSRSNMDAVETGSNNPYAAYLLGRQAPRIRPSFVSLPSHLLLHIVYCCFPQEDGPFEGDLKAVRQRRTLHWLETSLRLVNRKMYIVAMNVLRSVYLNAYDSLVRPPYSSDPFPSSNSVSRHSSSTLFPQHRELKTLDLFIAILAHEEVLYDTTSLHISRHEAYKDIFELMQPRSRLEDIVAIEGVKAGLVLLGDDISAPGALTSPQTPLNVEGKETMHAASSSSSSSLPEPSRTLAFATSKPLKKSKSSISILSAFSRIYKQKEKVPVKQQPMQSSRRQISPLPFASLSVSFSTRKVGLMYAPASTSESSGSSSTVTGSSSSAYGGSTYGALGVSHNSRARKRTIVEVQRERNEALESCAQRLIQGLREWMEEEM